MFNFYDFGHLRFTFWMEVELNQLFLLITDVDKKNTGQA